MPTTTRILYESDVPADGLSGKTVAVLGFGAQGRSHAMNLRDSGVRVIVANRPDSPNGKLASSNGFVPTTIADAVRQADLIILGLPDEAQPDVYRSQIAPHLRAGQAIGFIHGFNIHYKTIEVRGDIDVIMAAPKAAGQAVRGEFVRGAGVPALIAVHQDASGKARDVALAWARGIGCARSGIIETTFKDETETDLFGEQAVLCGGLTSLMKAGFDTLVEAGYPPEIAYFECVYEVKLIVDLIFRGGIEFMRRSISNTAEYGDLTRGPRIIDNHVRSKMREVLAEIRSGEFAREFRADHEGDLSKLKAIHRAEREHLLERTGRELREKMSWGATPEPPKQVR